MDYESDYELTANIIQGAPSVDPYAGKSSQRFCFLFFDTHTSCKEYSSQKIVGKKLLK